MSLALVPVPNPNLQELEESVERGLPDLLRVVDALEELEGVDLAGAIRSALDLARIRDSRAYYAVTKNFDVYVRNRFGIGRRAADMVIRRLQVVNNLLNEMRTTGSQLPPISGRGARVLGQLPDEEQGPAYREAVEEAEGEQPTVKELAAKVLTRKALLGKTAEEQQEIIGKQQEDVQRRTATVPRDAHASRIGRTRRFLERAKREISGVGDAAEPTLDAIDEAVRQVDLLA